MKTEKILFMDLDGTLLDDDKNITPGNRYAISQALKAGHKIVISTGRPLSSAGSLAKKLQLDMEGCYIIAYNGGCIYDAYRQETLYSVTVPLSYVRQLLDQAYAFGLHAHTYCEEGILTEHETNEVRQYAALTRMTYQVVPDVCRTLKDAPGKVLVINYENHSLLEQFQSSISDWAKGKVDSYFSCPEYLEIVSPGVSKGEAIRTLCQKLNIPMENTVSAGDADNDITMLQATQISAVMRNAADYMYAYGNYITKNDNNHDGIAEIINKFILNQS